MPKKYYKYNLFLIISAIIFGAAFVFPSKAEAVINVKGRILLQVQDKGQAWYVNPINNQRYYLGRPNDAFLVMRSLGLGVTNADLNIYLNKAPLRLAGRILLKVQDKGQAYYVDPVELKLYYLGRPDDAFEVMRKRGLGISNKDLATIIISPASARDNSLVQAPIMTQAPVVNNQVYSPSDIQLKTFSFKYGNLDYSLVQNFSVNLYNSYKNSSKVFTYYRSNEPENLREAFYNIFFNIKSGDNSLDDLVIKLKKVASDNNWSDDELLEFTVSFVQYIPYDKEKLANSSGINNNPYFPYETLYLNKGVCSDKTFLAVALLRKLGYGAAILDFPEINHSALGFACPKDYSINSSGYCYGETTNYFPLGVIPQNIDNGQAETGDEFNNLFNTSKLGKIEIYQKSSGKIYYGISALKNKIETINLTKASLINKQIEIDSSYALLKSKESEVNVLKTRLDSFVISNNISEYNSLIPEYNNLVNNYNSVLSVYREKVSAYNLKVKELNDLQSLFYQQ